MSELVIILVGLFGLIVLAALITIFRGIWAAVITLFRLVTLPLRLIWRLF